MEPTQLGIWTGLGNTLRAHDDIFPFGMDEYKMFSLLSRFKLLFYSIVFQFNMDNDFFPISRHSYCIGGFDIDTRICVFDLYGI